MTIPRVALVGAGRAGSAIARALAGENLATVGVVVDPSGSSLVSDISVASVADIPGDGALDAAIVAVPTPAHAEVLADLLTAPGCPPLVLCEKPLTDDLDDLRRVRALAAARGVTLRMLMHFASAPESTWLGEHRGELEERLGPCLTVTSVFGDDYSCGGDDASARARLGGPWVDSGVNSLSVVVQVVAIVECVERLQRDDIAVTVRYRGARGEDVRVTAAWDDPAGEKVTVVGFGDGEVHVDHRKGQITLGTETLYQKPEEAHTRRYGRMLAHYLASASAPDDRLEAEVMSWLLAMPAASVRP